MKKRGFTLIELLAVIVILAIIALIATPLVLNTIDKAKKGAAKASALEYMNAVERYMVEAMLDTTMPQLQPGVEYQLSSTKYEVAAVADPNTVYINDLINIKGDKPEKGYLIVNNQGTVQEMEMVMNKYPVECSNNKCEVTGDKEEENDKESYKAYSIGDAVTIDGIGYHAIKASSSNNEYVTLLRDESIGTMAFDDDSTDYETSTLKAYLNSTYKDTFGDKKSLIKEITLIEMGISISESGSYLLTGEEGTYAYILKNLENSSWLTNVNFYTKTVYSNGYGSENEYLYVGSDMYEGKVRAMFANYSGTYKGGGINSNAGSGEQTTGIDVRPVIVISKDAIKQYNEVDCKEAANALIISIEDELVKQDNTSTYIRVEGVRESSCLPEYEYGEEINCFYLNLDAYDDDSLAMATSLSFDEKEYKVIIDEYQFTLENGKINNGTITFNDSTVINVVNGKIAS